MSYRPQGKVPPEFRCPITFEIMEDPVEMDDGYTYEKEAIIVWLQEHNNQSPMTNKKISTNMKPNNSLKDRIYRYTHPSEYSSQNQITIIVKDINDRSLAIRIKKTDTILTLKNKIREMNNVPNHRQQRLIYMSRALKDESKTINDYNIKENTVVHLLLRVLGGFL